MIDFIIIGAQKAGTTTLFQLLNEHPQIFMPAAKELPFFTFDERYAQGLPAYMDEYFGKIPSSCIAGKATPQYLSDPRAAARIAQTLPDVRLIAVLRNPLDRALSHYRMSVRRSIENRTFDQVVRELSASDVAAHVRELETGREAETSCYLAWGEYGRELSAYFSRFPHKHIKIIFTEDLERDPLTVYRDLLAFLGVEEFVPGSLGQRFHEGGTQERMPWLRKAAMIGGIRRLWHLIPGRYRRPVTYWFHQFNIVKERPDESLLSGETGKRLIDYFQPDVQALESLIGRKVPWVQFR